MSDWNAISAFMAAVVPWPGSINDPGYINLQCSFTDRQNPGGKKRVANGWPFRTVDSLVNRAAWVGTTTQWKDTWYCLSLQKEAKPHSNGSGKLVAVRAARNALAVKALWIDVDVGKKDGYATLSDAVKAVMLFKDAVGLPPFSAIVGSGNGVHIYWISDKALTPTEWRPYAEGLKALLLQHGVKCDAGLTTDIARILRFPGTLNYKTEPPKPVQLFPVPLVMYDFATQLAVLPTVAPVHTPTPSSEAAPNIFAEGITAAMFDKPAFTIADTTSLSAGIDKYEEKLLNAEPILKQCGFLSHALMTGGKDYANPLWNLSVLCSTFMENGNAIAHALSKGHETYSPDGTQALYDRKLAERHDLGLGYPSCATIQGNGCGACATCPLLPKGKSPLNIRPAVTATVTPTLTPQSPTAQNLMLPDGYDVNDKGFICLVIEGDTTKDGETMPSIMIPLFQSVISDPWVETDPDVIHVTTTYDKGRTIAAQIKWEDIHALDLSRKLGLAKIKTVPTNKKHLETFLMAWLTKLHEAAQAQHSLPYGWYREGAKVRGFAFGGRLLKDDGSDHPCGTGDAKIRKVFHQQGDIQPWYDACRCITQQLRPELDAIIALSFAAPLMTFCGQNAGTLCAYGDSGAGKTAAYSVGIGVWGHSKKGKAVSYSTLNGIMKKMGELSNLPMYWDEIKDPKAQAAVYDYIYNATDGVEKDRMKADTSLQDRGVWQTAMMVAANISFVDYVMLKDPSHVAGVSRVLEYNVKRHESGPGKISTTEAAVIIDKLQTDYGNVGMLYAKYLAMNHAAVEAEVMKVSKQIETDMAATGEERIWVALVATLIVGSRIANELGATLGLPALKKFLYETYAANRNKRQTMMAVSGTRDTTESIMTAYFASVFTHDQMLWTKGMSQGVGKPDVVTILHCPKDTKNVSVTMGVAVRWDVQSRRLFILKDHLRDFLNEAGVGYGTCFDSLAKEYGMKIRPKLRIGAGVFDIGRATLCVFENVGPDHDWADMMYKFTHVSERPPRTEPDPDATPDGSGGGGGEVDPATGLASASSVIAITQRALRG